MQKLICSFLMLLLISSSIYAQRRMENLDRGLIAIKVDEGVYVNWRINGQEWYNVNYNLYKDGIKLNTEPITGASNFTDTEGTLASKYQVAAIVDGIEETKCKETSVLPQPYIQINLRPVPKINGVPDSYYEAYRINDIVAGDLDGDGEYELIVKRVNAGYDSNKPYENKYYTLFEAYKLDGTYLWTIDVGPNLISDVEINALVYDFDGDGKAEVVMRTSEGSVDGLGNVIPDLGNSLGEPTPDGITNYRNHFYLNSSWYEYKGPEYLSLFDGLTGEMLDRIDHIAREPVAQWGGSGGSQQAHRATKFHYGAPYLDGKNPSVLITRGIYGRIKMLTYDIKDKKFVKRWDWDSGDGSYSGQGNHNYSIADVDNDGCDEIIYGSMTIDHDGKGMYTTGFGHGDALHVGDFDPYRKGLEVFACLEGGTYAGSNLRAAESGEVLLQYVLGRDCGRCMAANITDKYKGAEAWPGTGGTFSCSERRVVPDLGGSVNFRIFWDGDLLDELCDHNWLGDPPGKGTGVVSKYTDSAWKKVFETDYFSCNHTKGTPCLQADILGDWREELIYRSNDESNIRIYLTTYPTEHRIYTLMHDMQYRQAIAWQMCGYNQPPHVSYYLSEAEGITLPPPPVMDNQRLVFQASSDNWNTADWKKDNINVTYQDNLDILFDISGYTSETIKLNSTLTPRNLFINSSSDYSFDMTSGKLSGSMKLVKQGAGKLTFNGNHDYSGVSELWDGITSFNGILSNSPVWMNRFVELEASGTLGKSVSMNYESILYPAGKRASGTLNIGENLELKERSVLEFDMDNDPSECDKIIIAGTLTISEEAIFRFINGNDLPEGDYILIQASGITGDITSLTIEGLENKIAALSCSGNDVLLSVKNMRPAASIVWKGFETSNNWNLGADEYFTKDNTDTYFAVGDIVRFDDTALTTTVSKEGNLPAGEIIVDASDNYIIQGSGKITGSGSLTKSGTGKLTLSGINEYLGATIVTGGTLAVENLPHLVYAGSIGFPSNDPELFILNGATLTTTKTQVSGRALKIGTEGGIIEANSEISWDERITGGTLTKTGYGRLNLFSPYNNLEKMIIQSGTVELKAESSSPGTTVVFEGGTLQCYNDQGSYSTASYNIEVPVDKSGTIILDDRCSYTGKLTGEGKLTIQSNWIRSDLSGNWSDFAGTITVTSDSDGGDLRFNNNSGLPKAELNITGTLSVYNNAGTAFSIGALSGSADATLTDENWTIGAKNTNTTFAGLIRGNSLIKVGSGALKLTNANTYTGSTTINGGYLLAMNNSGSATGTGNVTVNNEGALGGNGTISGNVSVYTGGLVEPGDPTATSWLNKIGTLNCEKNFTLAGTVRLSVRNGSGFLADRIVVKGTATISGDLEIEIVNGGDIFPLGAELALFDFQGAVNGSFKTMALPQTESGTKWDTDNLYTSGKIKVVNSTSINSPETKTLQVYPNPARDYLIISLSGNEVYHQADILDMTGNIVMETKIDQEKIDISSLPQGIYLLRLKQNGNIVVARFIKTN